MIELMPSEKKGFIGIAICILLVGIGSYIGDVSKSRVIALLFIFGGIVIMFVSFYNLFFRGWSERYRYYEKLINKRRKVIK